MVELIKCLSFDSNSYLIVEAEKCVIVDTGLNFKQKAKEIQAKYDVVGILLTHGHLDHIDGIGFFDVPIYIHKLDYDFLTDDNLSLYKSFGLKKSFDFSKLNVVLIEDGFKLNLLNESITVIHTPGHTQGSVCYLYKNTLFSGDTLFKGSVGRADFPTGDFEVLLNSIAKLLKMFSEKLTQIEVLSGHTDKTTLAYELKHNPFLKQYRHR